MRVSAFITIQRPLRRPAGGCCFPPRLQARARRHVSKRLGSRYRSGRSRHWVKSKNSKHPAVKRESEEDCGKRNGASASTKSSSEQRNIWSYVCPPILVHASDQGHVPLDNRNNGGSDHQVMVLPCRRE